MRRSPLFPVLLLAALFLLPAAGSGADKPLACEEVVDKVITAYGGAAALAKVQSYAFAGTLWAKTTAHADLEPVPFSRTFKRSSSLKVVNSYPRGTETRILSPQGAWRTGEDGKLAAVTGDQRHSMTLQAARADLPWLLLDRRKDTRLLEPFCTDETDAKGKKTEVKYPLLEVTLADSSVLVLLVHPTNYRISAVKAFVSKGDKDAVFMTLYDDWRSEGGVLFPVREENFAMKVPTGVTRVHSIKVNPALKDKDFAP